MRWLLRLCCLGLRLGHWLRLYLTCRGCSSLLHLILLHQFGADEVQELPRIRTSYLLSDPNHDRLRQSHVRWTLQESFPHLELVTPRSDLGVRVWLPVDVLEDLGDGLHLNILRMFLRRLSSRTEWTTVGNFTCKLS